MPELGQPIASYDPIERLTRVGDFLLDQAHLSPDFMEGDKVIVMVISADNQGGIAARGYSTHEEVVSYMARFVDAVTE